MDNSIVSQKRCSKKEKCIHPENKDGWLPATSEYFHHDKGKKLGLGNYCKWCACANTQKNTAKKDPEQIRTEKREWMREARKKHPERYKAIKKRFNIEHREENNAYKRDYRHRNPLQIQAEQRRRQARRKGAEGTFTTEDIAIQYRSQKGMCWWCGKKLNGKYHIDHLVPISKGGTNWANNIVLACAPCNCSKKDHLPQEWNGRLL